MSGQTAFGQWNLIADMLGQLNDNEQNQFFANFNNLNNNWNINQEDLNYNLDELFNFMDNPCLQVGLDSSYLAGFDEGMNDLNILLQGSGLPDSDQDTILGALGQIQEELEFNFDSLGNIFNQFGDIVNTDPDWDVTILNYDDLVDNSFNVLEDTFGNVVNTNLNDVGDIAHIIGQLLNEALFTDLELAFGTQAGDFKYWNDRYSASAKVLRVGSVPRFDGTAVECSDGIVRLPIEPRWHVEASWMAGRIPTSINNIPPGAEGQTLFDNNGNRNFNPLVLFGDFAMMATPDIGRIGNTSFKLITSLGLEAGTYAPAHREYAPPFSSGNKGFATGFGPQVGSGFAAVAGPLVIYSMGTIARGTLLRCPLPYRYNSRRFEAGVRYGNRINVRYTTGKTTWQDNDNRRARIRHQLTIGIILGSLHN
ncbi:MAG TPA: hypothetical protein ENJ20_05310 [Bacteroidetes bacterium]|nr:hypothetical protein [Bacteroidota bacterium]